jgi:hypothetical protein
MIDAYFDHDEGDIDIELFDQYGSSLAYSGTSSSMNGSEYIEFDLAMYSGGPLYIAVWGPWNGQGYDLAWYQDYGGGPTGTEFTVDLVYDGTDPFDASHPIVIAVIEDDFGEAYGYIKADSNGIWVIDESVIPGSPYSSGYFIVFVHDLNNNFVPGNEVDEGDIMGWYSEGYPGNVSFDENYDIVWPGGTFYVDFALPNIEPDSWEPDDTYIDAWDIYVNDVYYHSITNGDVDWLVFEAFAGNTYSITTSSAGGYDVDTVMGLYDTNGVTLLDENDDYGDGYFSQLIFSPGVYGWYYVKVRGYDVGSIGEYDITLEQLP